MEQRAIMCTEMVLKFRLESFRHLPQQDIYRPSILPCKDLLVMATTFGQSMLPVSSQPHQIQFMRSAFGLSSGLVNSGILFQK